MVGPCRCRGHASLRGGGQKLGQMEVLALKMGDFIQTSSSLCKYVGLLHQHGWQTEAMLESKLASSQRFNCPASPRTHTKKRDGDPSGVNAKPQYYMPYSIQRSTECQNFQSSCYLHQILPKVSRGSKPRRKAHRWRCDFGVLFFRIKQGTLCFTRGFT